MQCSNKRKGPGGKGLPSDGGKGLGAVSLQSVCDVKHVHSRDGERLGHNERDDGCWESAGHL